MRITGGLRVSQVENLQEVLLISITTECCTESFIECFTGNFTECFTECLLRVLLGVFY